MATLTVGDTLKAWISPIAIIAAVIGAAWVTHYKVSDNCVSIKSTTERVRKLELSTVRVETKLENIEGMLKRIDKKL